MLIKAQCIHGELTRFHFVNNDAVAVISKPHMGVLRGQSKTMWTWYLLWKVIVSQRNVNQNANI